MLPLLVKCCEGGIAEESGTNFGSLTFSIITEESIYNKSPVVLAEGRHLGLEAWSVEFVYQYACSKIFPFRKKLERNAISLQDVELVNSCLMTAILINPYVSTFWNMRRNLVRASRDFSVERKLSQIVLFSCFKSSDAFAFRRWTLEQETIFFRQLEPNCVWEAFCYEMVLCRTIFESVPDNYHCWTYRQCCIYIFENDINLKLMLCREFQFINDCMNRHVVLSSVYHYKQFLINFVKNFYYFRRIDPIHRSTEILLGLDIVSRRVMYKSSNIARFWEQFGNYRIGIFSCKFIVWVCVFWLELINEEEDRRFYMHENFWLQRRFILYTLFERLNNNIEGMLDDHNVVVDVKSNLLDSNILFTVCKSNYKMEKEISTNPAHKKIINSPFYRALINGEKYIVRKFMCPSNHNLIRRHISWLKYFLRFDIELTSDPF
ncbi:uncharacterized protein LOC125503438 isoform X2 [Dendroctonus ponderosae]|uniref:uncharacterized protein LOC125503438 isoform X2 n=1 Tax=Dendroctonus ponderosae TaxID=77166 RepID=UPI0020350689|nr:uncharacterized protein LOC125503438 isoform X2 [Dendroctonus ponderosae]